jgi:thiosulfate reductase cytochrome b subunit
VVASYPFLLDIFGGHQSARTIHFFSFAVLLLFVLVHVLMIVLSGAGKQLRGMTLGVKNEE